MNTRADLGKAGVFSVETHEQMLGLLGLLSVALREHGGLSQSVIFADAKIRDGVCLHPLVGTYLYRIGKSDLRMLSQQEADGLAVLLANYLFAVGELRKKFNARHLIADDEETPDALKLEWWREVSALECRRNQ